ncbi:MAG: hypothetical protein V2A67_05050 [Bacteroidota bacterium]
MSYRKVIHDFSKAEKDLKTYLKDLTHKYQILLELISNYNDGRSKGFYCLAVDLLPISELTIILKEIEPLGKVMDADIKERGRKIREIFEAHARKLKIELILNK